VTSVAGAFGGVSGLADDKDALSIRQRATDLQVRQVQLQAQLTNETLKQNSALAANDDKLRDIGQKYEDAALSANAAFDRNIAKLNESRAALASTKTPMSQQAYVKAIMDETEALYDAIGATQSEKAALEEQKDIKISQISKLNGLKLNGLKLSPLNFSRLDI
jgi:hypothetical protein